MTFFDNRHPDDENEPRPRISWIVRLVLFAAISVFFLFFGIQVLISAYRMTDPFSFIMTFFSSNLIILISLALFLGFVIRIRRAYVKIDDVTPENVACGEKEKEDQTRSCIDDHTS